MYSVTKPPGTGTVWSSKWWTWGGAAGTSPLTTTWPPPSAWRSWTTASGSPWAPASASWSARSTATAPCPTAWPGTSSSTWCRGSSPSTWAPGSSCSGSGTWRTSTASPWATSCSPSARTCRTSSTQETHDCRLRTRRNGLTPSTSCTNISWKVLRFWNMRKRFLKVIFNNLECLLLRGNL